MKILYYSPHPTVNMAAPSGPGTHIREVVAAFENEGHTVIRMIAGGEQLKSGAQSQIQYKRRSIKKFIPDFIWQTLKDWKLLQFDGYNKKALSDLIAKERPDAIYERSYYLMSSGYETAKIFGIPYYCEINAPYPEEKRSMEGKSFFLRKARDVEKAQVLQAGRYFVVSTALRDYLIKRSGVDSKNIVVTPNAVNPKNIVANPAQVAAIKSRLGINSDHCVIGFVGSIFPYHGVDTLLESFNELYSNGNKQLRLLIVGDGEILPQLKSYVIEKSLNEVVVFTGNVPHKEVFNYIEIMDIAVMARSNWYGSPVKIFEYGALGKKIIAPYVVPVRDVMQHEKDGLLVRENSGDLTKALSKMIAEPAAGSIMAEHFRQKVLSKYTLAKNWKSHIAKHVMNVLILTDGISPFVMGGMQKHSFYLSKFLVLRGHSVTLVHCVPHGKTLPGQDEVAAAMGLPEGHGLTSVALHFPQAGVMPGHYIKESYLYSRRVYDRVRDVLDTFDFVYIKGFAGWYLLAEKSKGKKMPPVGIKFHGYEMFQPPASFKSRFHHWLLRGPVKWNSRQADYVFSYGGKITPIIESIGVKRDRIIEIPTGIESGWMAMQSDFTPKQEVQFVFVGRFERRKGIEELNEALSSLLAAGGFHFHFIGPVPPSRKIRSERITYHGAVTDTPEMQRLLDQCQVLVVPSHSEGMPNVIMEGMARSLAVIATDVGAVSVVVDDTNGWLIKPASVSELRDALKAAIGCGHDLLAQKRRSSQQKIGQFFWENVIVRTESEIQQRISRR